MWKLNRPAISAESTFQTCISHVRDSRLKTRFESIRQNVVDAEREYINSAETARLHLINPGTSVGGIVTEDEMLLVYTGRMVPKSSPGRVVYNQLISAAPHNRCPFCGLREVTTLDHHLSKTDYPALVVTPVNLIPSCSDCNKTKSDVRPRSAEDVFLHPYFDEVQNERWLFARVMESNPASLAFYVQPPSSWSQALANRVINHFAKLNLDGLYRSHAAQEITNIRYQLTNILSNATHNEVKQSLEDSYLSRLYNRINSWPTATYHAFVESDWFCSGGFM